MSDSNDKIIRLYTRLNSLKQNLPKSTTCHEKYVGEYHSIVQELEGATKLDLAEFRIPDGEVKPLLASFNYLSGEKKYTAERFCDKNFLLTKLDALLNYFQIKYLSEPKRTIGFKQNG
jgi:hypothetical protein